MDNKEWFRELDEQERVYAPEDLPVDQQGRVRADEGHVYGDPNEPPAPAPVANVGTSAQADAAPPNIGHVDHGGAPGDPETEARDPLDSDSDLR
jgi:hypothetical protein